MTKQELLDRLFAVETALCNARAEMEEIEVVIVVRDITANDKESAKVKAENYLKKALEGEG